MNILLLGSFLILDLAQMSLLDHPVDLWEELKHEDSFPTKMRSCRDARVSQELMRGLNNPMA